MTPGGIRPAEANANEPRVWPGSGRPYRAWAAGAALLALAVLLNGCALQRFGTLGRNLQDLQQFAAVHGAVADSSAPADGVQPRVTILLLRQLGDSWALAGRTQAHRGEFALRLVSGETYRVLAFRDDDGDRHVGPAELRAVGSPFVAPSRGATHKLSLRLRVPTPSDGALPVIDPTSTGSEPSALPVVIGDVTTIDDPVFGPAAAELGLWAPADFLSTAGGGVYLLQPYDARRVPVLFVHGAGGSPLDFAALTKAVRASHVQPWVFFYPSGLSLARSAEMLAGIVADLQRRHRFDSLLIVAHSMGGLVARGAIHELDKRAPALRVPLFVTLATPWGGHAAAELGVRMAPRVVPSWIDMQVGSPYQQAVLGRRLPADTRHHLVFAFRGRGDDGVVSLSSQLNASAQRSATAVRGFEEDHMSILQADAPVAYVVAVVNAASRPNTPMQGLLR